MVRRVDESPKRIRVIMTIMCAIGLLLVVRLYIIQIARGEAYVEKAESQYVHTTQDIFERGTIYYTTKDGEQVSAASMQSGYILAVNPTLVVDAEAVYAAIGADVGIDKEEFVRRATLPNRTYVEIEPRLSTEQYERIAALDLDGVQLYRNRWRYYPGETVGARSLGFIGFTDNGTEQRGKYGLEYAYDEVLHREADDLSVNFFAEIFSNMSSVLFENPTEKRGDIVTTIEPTVARMLDRILDDTHTKYDSRVTGGIVMDPRTGAMYALNALPSYNPNDRRDATIDLFQNPLVENVYEMGSIIKALTVAAGLDAGVITPQSTYYDPGAIELNTFTIRNFDGRGRGTVDMQAVLNQSLNTGVAHIVKLLGHTRFREYFTALKLGSETGIDLPYEAAGLVRNLESPREVEYATASFGQGIATTPVATIRALAALGNGGHLVTPHIVSALQYEDGTEKEIQYPAGTQVFSTETSETVSRMLATVVDDALRNGAVSLPHHSVAAKTGTAQIAKPGGGYYDDRYLHSFFGYFPAYDPQFIIFLYTVEPKGVQYASETLTEPFMDLTKFLINYYNIPPDR